MRSVGDTNTKTNPVKRQEVITRMNSGVLLGSDKLNSSRSGDENVQKYPLNLVLLNNISVPRIPT